MSTSQPSKQRRKNAYLAAALVALGIGVIAAHNADAGPVLMGISVAAFVAAIALNFLWFASLDELAQRAHYEAWFWGGSIGLLTLPFLGIVMLLTGGQLRGLGDFLRHVGANADPHDAFLVGITVALVPPVVGYTLWWALFWLRRR